MKGWSLLAADQWGAFPLTSSLNHSSSAKFGKNALNAVINVVTLPLSPPPPSVLTSSSDLFFQSIEEITRRLYQLVMFMLKQQMFCVI